MSLACLVGVVVVARDYGDVDLLRRVEHLVAGDLGALLDRLLEVVGVDGDPGAVELVELRGSPLGGR